MKLDWKEIEDYWRNAWSEAKIFESDPDYQRKKIFVTFPFPYMNGPLHLGHCFTASRVDAFARYKRMNGYNVLFPWAWHWTGETIEGASERLKLGDKDLIRAFREIDGVSEEDMKKFVEPVYMARYYTNEGKKAVKKVGFSIDWRREFHTTSYDPCFSRFIEWQYNKLKEKGYIIKGTHPVVWCPNCESPTGEADRLMGEDIAPEEYILIKFKFEDSFIVAATFRPETIYGVTNLWINPEADYVKANVDGEIWILSKEASIKLNQQLKEVKIIETFSGKQVVGKICNDPIKNNPLFILPASFVDPKHGSGIVYSVPAHAPYDWLALNDLQKNPNILKKMNIDPEIVSKISPISIIKIEGYGDFPALEVIKELDVKDQKDLKAEDATKLLYKNEFHKGILKENCMEYSGKFVNEIKDKLIIDFRRLGISDIMYDLPSLIVCRCTSPCEVKVLKDQWFLIYSDQNWKKKAHECISLMKILPENAKGWFNDSIDWFKEKACARKKGLGTKIPWDPDWIVETLSDSTIHMAYYTISKYVNTLNLDSKQLDAEFFDYIFYGIGNLEKIAVNSGISIEKINEIREEFLYWYPVDFRNSAKELIPNHLTFFIFHHVVLFPKIYWPKMISVNGMLTIEGQKMSKSKGNFITIKDAVEKYGADPTRCTLLLAAENMDDADWRERNVKDVKSKLESFYELSRRIVSSSGSNKVGNIEIWLISTLQKRILSVTENLEVLKTRTALENALYEIWGDIKWYFRRTDEINWSVLKDVLSIWIKLLSPFIPHVSEQIWRDLGGKSFLSLEFWPSYDKNKICIPAQETEKYLKNILTDTSEVIKATGLKPTRIYYYTSTIWKWKIYIMSLKLGENRSLNNIMSNIGKDQELKKFVKEAVNFSKKINKLMGEMSFEDIQNRLSVGILDEFNIIKENLNFFEKEFKSRVEVFEEEDIKKFDPKKRSNFAEPFRPAIYIE